jgi:hypothetical protein
MKDELKTFLKNKLNTNENNDVMGIDSMSGQFSNF